MDFNFLQSSYENFTVISSSKYDICVCCLSRNASFVSLITCKHAEFFKFIPSFVMDFNTKLVCRECHAMLRKFTMFRQQVENSIIHLKSQAFNLDTDSKSLNLKLSPIEISYAVNSEPIMFEVKAELANERPEYQTSIFKHEPDSDHNSDLDYIQPLFEVKKEEVKIVNEVLKTKKKLKVVKEKPPLAPVVIKKNIKKPVSKWKSADNLAGKIRIVFFTEKEVILERDKNRNKESYMSLPYKCEDCIVAFDHESTYKEHVDKRHTMKPGGVSCVICKLVLNCKKAYKEHYERHFRQYECEACGRRNSTLNAVMKHYSDTHEPLNESYECKDCDYITDDYCRFRYHREQRHRGNNQCQQCGQISSSHTALKSHIRTVHSANKLYYGCKACDKKYLTKMGLKAHNNSIHNTNKAPSFCSSCKTSFKSAAGYKHHLLTHSAHVTEETKRFACDHCGNKYAIKYELIKHILLTHMDTPRHRCEKCNKEFVLLKTLKRHIDFVHNKKQMPKNKICDHCGRGFTTLQILKAHVRTHTGERPLSCTKCTATFAHSGALYTHNKLVHLRK